MNLDRPILVSAALKILDEVGLEGLTLRRLASDLGVQAPALYWHFKSKQELLDEMATQVFLEGTRKLQVKPGLSWKKWMIRYGKGLRQILLSHRDGARMISGTRITDVSLYDSMENSLQFLAREGFSLRRSMLVMSTIYSYVIGFVIEEQAVIAAAKEPVNVYDPEVRAARMDAEKYPLAIEAGKYLFQEYDRHFEDGLMLIVDGLSSHEKAKAKHKKAKA
jgi:TetR/AcrR family tetracycline transcriptional repressor